MATSAFPLNVTINLTLTVIFKKLAPYGTDGRLLRCLQSVLPVSVEMLPKAETSFYGFFSVSKQLQYQSKFCSNKGYIIILVRRHLSDTKTRTDIENLVNTNYKI